MNICLTQTKLQSCKEAGCYLIQHGLCSTEGKIIKYIMNDIIKCYS